MVYNYETPIPPQVYDGKPPLEMLEHDGDIYWRCECGRVGISSSREWAHSDVERHRRNGNHIATPEVKPCLPA